MPEIPIDKLINYRPTAEQERRNRTLRIWKDAFQQSRLEGYVMISHLVMKDLDELVSDTEFNTYRNEITRLETHLRLSSDRLRDIFRAGERLNKTTRRYSVQQRRRRYAERFT